VYNYNTMEKVKALEAHQDSIRYLEVHPNLPYLLTASDDMSIKLWDWDKGWDCTTVYEGHAHYCMMVKWNPKDTNTFASASLDRTIKVWGVSASTPHFSLEGHERGVNCVDYYPGGDKPYLISGADDRTVRIWDYQTKTCIQVLDGHNNNVCSVLFHPRLPVLVTAAEDGTVRIWHSTTYRAETTLNYGMERAWTLAAAQDAKKLAVGCVKNEGAAAAAAAAPACCRRFPSFCCFCTSYSKKLTHPASRRYDEGCVVIQLGNDLPVASLDTHTGKLVWANNSDVQTVSLRASAAENGDDLNDGEKIPLAPKDLGATELYPQKLMHNCNGRFIVVIGDGEYIIYTSQALRNKAFGSALDFVWSAVGTGDYAVRESISRVKTFKNFKEQHTLRPPISAAEGLYGGAALAIRGHDCIVFYDWASGTFIRKIDVVPTQVIWSDGGELVMLVCADTSYALRFDREVTEAALAAGTATAEDGVDGSFELVYEMSDAVGTGQWVGDCFLYTTGNKLNYFVGGEVMTLCHLDHEMFMLGYLAKEEKVYLIDKASAVVGCVLLSLLSTTLLLRLYHVAALPLLPRHPTTPDTTTHSPPALPAGTRCGSPCSSTRRPWCGRTSTPPTRSSRTCRRASTAPSPGFSKAKASRPRPLR